jgi:hypothetical protein
MFNYIIKGARLSPRPSFETMLGSLRENERFDFASKKGRDRTLTEQRVTMSSKKERKRRIMNRDGSQIKARSTQAAAFAPTGFR